VVEIPNLYIHTQSKRTNHLTCRDHINNTIFVYKDDCLKISKKCGCYSCGIIIGGYLYGYVLFNIYDYYYNSSVEISHISYIFIGTLGAIATFLLLFTMNKCVRYTIIKPTRKCLCVSQVQPVQEPQSQPETSDSGDNVEIIENISL